MLNQTPDLALIPLAEIDEAALSRDRRHIDPEALGELRLSIAAHGLRMPIEVFHHAEESEEGHRYGLISGFRRLRAFREQLALTGQDRYRCITALIRQPPSVAAAVAAMVEENEIRVGLSAWERARVAAIARDEGIFPTIEQAVDSLYSTASRQKRWRLRAIAHLTEELDGHLAAPHGLSENQALRLAAAVQNGFGEVIRTALTESSLTDPIAQWQLLLPIIAESERPDSPETVHLARPGRTRRLVRPRAGITIRREANRDGYLLHITGRDATSALVDQILDEIERMFGPR